MHQSGLCGGSRPRVCVRNRLWLVSLFFELLFNGHEVLRGRYIKYIYINRKIELRKETKK